MLFISYFVGEILAPQYVFRKCFVASFDHTLINLGRMQLGLAKTLEMLQNRKRWAYINTAHIATVVRIV